MSLRSILILSVLASATLANLAAAEGDESDVADAIEVIAASDAIPSETVANSVPKESVPARKSTVWVPTEVGRRWTYVYAREQRHVREGAEPVVETLRGIRVDEVTALAPEFGQGVIRVTSKLSGRQVSGDVLSSEERVGFFHYAGSSYKLVAEQLTDPVTGTTTLVQYDTPLSLLESGAEPGQRWKVGVRSRGDLHTVLEGEVLGAEDVTTPYGLFKHCLVIRLTGQISGIVEAYGSRMEVPSGDFIVTEWYAPGVGLVLAKEELSQIIVYEDGTRMEYSERTQFALRSSESLGAAVPAAVEP